MPVVDCKLINVQSCHCSNTTITRHWEMGEEKEGGKGNDGGGDGDLPQLQQWGPSPERITKNSSLCHLVGLQSFVSESLYCVCIFLVNTLIEQACLGDQFCLRLEQ